MTTTKACSVDGCDRPYYAHGWCNLHYTRWRNYGSTTLPVREPRRCSVDDCDRPHVARGFCPMHYQRWQNHGDPLWTPPSRPPVCSVEDCGQPRFARGFCRKHYRRWRNYGDPLGGPVRRRRCAVDGCDSAPVARGQCGMHFEQWYRERHMCGVDGCDRLHYQRRFCRMHYRRWYRYGDPLAAPAPPANAATMATANTARAKAAGARHAAAAAAVLADRPPTNQITRRCLELRVDHPDATLAELAAMMSPPITKDAFAGRLRCTLAETPSSGTKPPLVFSPDVNNVNKWITARFFEDGYSHAAIATMTGLGRKSVNAILHAAVEEKWRDE